MKNFTVKLVELGNPFLDIVDVRWGRFHVPNGYTLLSSFGFPAAVAKMGNPTLTLSTIYNSNPNRISYINSNLHDTYRHIFYSNNSKDVLAISHSTSCPVGYVQTGYQVDYFTPSRSIRYCTAGDDVQIQRVALTNQSASCPSDRILVGIGGYDDVSTGFRYIDCILVNKSINPTSVHVNCMSGGKFNKYLTVSLDMYCAKKCN
jgi:hypothetical protein